MLWSTDDKFEVPTAEEVDEFITKHSIKHLKYKSRQWACEEYALGLVYQVRYIRSFCLESELNWPFGEIFGDKKNGRNGPHYWNICRCDDGFYGIEPQDDNMWKMSKQNDNPILIKI